MKILKFILLTLIFNACSGPDKGERVTDLSEYLWKNRVILVSGTDTSLINKQKKNFEEMSKANEDRDLKFIDQSQISASDSRPSVDFEVKLIGKDGTIKAEYNSPLKMESFYKLIDVMPMRKAEIYNRK